MPPVPPPSPWSLGTVVHRRYASTTACWTSSPVKSRPWLSTTNARMEHAWDITLKDTRPSSSPATASAAASVSRMSGSIGPMRR